jgi:hypothetical protein
VARRSARYDSALAAVKKVVDEHDPVGLLEIGAPSDEYDPEIADLVRLVLGPNRPTEESVSDVWRRWFGEDHGIGHAALADALARLHDQYREPLE